MLTTASGYQATRRGDKLIVHDVPIFAECYRPPRKGAQHDGKFDADWIRSAVDYALLRHSEGYFGPLHIRHHGSEVLRAGTFRVTGTGTIRYEGKDRMAVLAEFTVTDPDAQEDVLKERLPFRSVEILHPAGRPDGGGPEFDSVALLDHEVPFLRLPNLVVREVQEDGGNPVPNGTIAPGWAMGAADSAGPLVAWFAEGERTALLFREETMSTKTTAGEQFGAGVPQAKAANKKSAPFVKFEDDADKGEKGDGEQMEEEAKGLDIAAICKAIEAGEITVADMDAIRAAMARYGAPEEEQPEEQLAPAAVPGGEAMKAETTGGEAAAQFAAERIEMQQQIDALSAKFAAVEAREKRGSEVAAAVKELSGRGLLNIEEDLTKQHEQFGAAGLKSLVELLKKRHPVTHEDGNESPTARFAAASELALSFSDKGDSAVEQAMGFEQQFDWLSKNRSVPFSKETYVKDQMERALRSA